METARTILLVEDNRNDILLVQRAFRKANLAHSIQVIEDGDSAVLYLAGGDPYTDRDQYPLPALILLDLKLPRRSGLEVLAWLKQQPDLKRLPVVVLTSSGETIDIHRAYDLGANSYLVKPPSFADLKTMLESLNLYWLTLNQNPQMYLD